MDEMTADQILRIPLAQPERLFSAPATIDAEFKTLAMTWHPDRNKDPQADDVMAHIKALRDAAREKVRTDTWRTPGVYMFKTSTGSTMVLKYKISRDIPEGEVLIGEKNVAYFIDDANIDLFNAGIAMINGLSYSSEDMRKEFSRYMPAIAARTATADGRGVLFLKNRPDIFPLRDVVDHYKGTLPEEHSVWIMSALLNIACYLEFAQVSHNAILIDNLFISPEQHEILLFGGWWYAQPVGRAMLAAPAQALAMMPPARHSRPPAASTRLDRMMMRAVVRELMGDRSGFKLLSLGVRPEIVAFLRAPLGATAVKDYFAWHQAIETAFGARRFTAMPITQSDIYERV